MNCNRLPKHAWIRCWWPVCNVGDMASILVPNPVRILLRESHNLVGKWLCRRSITCSESLFSRDFNSKLLNEKKTDLNMSTSYAEISRLRGIIPVSIIISWGIQIGHQYHYTPEYDISDWCWMLVTRLVTNTFRLQHPSSTLIWSHEFDKSNLLVDAVILKKVNFGKIYFELLFM